MNEPQPGTTRAEDPKHHSVTAALQKPGSYLYCFSSLPLLTLPSCTHARYVLLYMIYFIVFMVAPQLNIFKLILQKQTYTTVCWVHTPFPVFL